jgi:hypothetical protein
MMTETLADLSANVIHPARHDRELYQPATAGCGTFVLDFIVGTTNRSESTAIGHSVARRAWVFPSLWVFIGFVSAVDAYLTVRFQAHLPFEEQNPISLVVLSLSDWNPAQFIGLKYMGSTLVLGILTALYARNPRLGFTVTSAVAAFQFGLLCYLVL